MNSSGNESDITVLERQRVRMKWQQIQNQNQNQNASSQGSSIINMNNMITTCDSQGLQIPIASSPAPSFDTISTTFTSPPSLANPKLTHSNKRKPHHPPIPKVVVENVNKDKRIKVVVPEDDDDDGESKNNTTDANSKNNNKEKNSAAAAAADTCSNSKPDYIHVRARRGQATDSHSLAERVRREKISERMKFLQDLVPGCNKITGKAGMLDEIINYVQSLQRQVEFLSMKLATVNPSLDFNIDHLFDKEVFSTCDGNTSFQAMGMSSEMNNNPYLQFNSPHQIVSYGGLDTGMNINTSDMGLRRTISAPVSIPQTFIDSSSFSHILPSSTWEGDFQNIYNSLTLDQPRLTSFPSQLFTGLVEASNLKMEM